MTVIRFSYTDGRPALDLEVHPEDPARSYYEVRPGVRSHTPTRVVLHQRARNGAGELAAGGPSPVPIETSGLPEEAVEAINSDTVAVEVQGYIIRPQGASEAFAGPYTRRVDLVAEGVATVSLA